MAVSRTSSQSLGLVLLLLIGASAQQLPSTLSCGPGNAATTAASCDYFLNATDSCAMLSDKIEQRKCMCIQPVFNAIFDCESELRLCYDSNQFDPLMSQASSLWTSLCNTFISTIFTPTTPVVSKITSTFDDPFCYTVVRGACAAVKEAIGKCATITDESLSSSCTCQPAILSNDYTCEFIGNTTCLHAPAALTDMVFYSGCANFASVIGTGLAGPTTRTISFQATTTPSPGSKTTGPSQPTSSNPSAAHNVAVPCVTTIYISIAITLFQFF